MDVEMKTEAEAQALDPVREQVLEENRRVHTLENAHYLDRHPEQTNRYQKRILKSALDEFERHLDRPGGEVLDVGCGTGYLFLPLLRRGFQMTGVDLSETLVEVLDRRVRKEFVDDVRLVAQDVESFLQQETKRYDGIVCSAILHHLYDYESAVRQLAERLKPGGILLIFFEPLKQRIASKLRFRLHRLLGRLDEARYERDMHRRGIPLIRDDYEVADYQRRFGGIDPDHLTHLLNDSGLGLLEKTAYCARRTAWAAWIANRLLGTANTFNLLARKF